MQKRNRRPISSCPIIFGDPLCVCLYRAILNMQNRLSSPDLGSTRDEPVMSLLNPSYENKSGLPTSGQGLLTRGAFSSSFFFLPAGHISNFGRFQNNHTRLLTPFTPTSRIRGKSSISLGKSGGGRSPSGPIARISGHLCPRVRHEALN